ncbi:MAG: hypothetical protein ABI813_06980 [Bacteroidota bacterium]
MLSRETASLRMNGVVNVYIFKEEDKVCASSIAVGRLSIVNKLPSLEYPEKSNISLLSKQNHL